MDILIIKISSLGDVIHTLPGLSDLKHYQPDIQIDWVVEEDFADIVKLHPGIRNVIPIAIRRWRQNWLGSLTALREFRQILTARHYDLVIDAQGLCKSAIIGRFAKGPVHGFDRHSAKEALVAWLYQASYQVDKDRHAVARIRELFAKVLGYTLTTSVDYGISKAISRTRATDAPGRALRRLMFLHGTTWPSKHWPDVEWFKLAKITTAAGFEIRLPYQSKAEYQRAKKITDQVPSAELVPAGGLGELLSEMSMCTGVVSVDTGLGHLATALNLPLVGIYGATSVKLTGFYGPRQEVITGDHLACIPCLNKHCQYDPKQHQDSFPPCYQTISAQRVFNALVSLLEVSAN